MDTPTEDPPPITPHFGTAVTADRRLGRPELEAELDAAMGQTNGARMFGLRRTGKSTEAMAFRTRFAAAWPDRHLVEVNAEGCTSEAILLLDILRALPSKGFAARITQAIGSDNTLSQTLRDALQKFTGSHADIQDFFGPIMTAIEGALRGNDGLVLIIDELPWLCRSVLESDPEHGRSRIDVLLAKLRRWRSCGVRMLLLGSIGMAALGRKYQLDLNHLNDLELIEVRPLSREEALTLVRALELGSGVKGWSAAHTESLLDECVALYPASIQKAFIQLSVGQRAVSLDRIPERFAERIRPDLDGAFFTQFDRRLLLYRELGEPLASLLPGLLKRLIAAPGQQLERTALFDSITPPVEEADLGDALAILREDGFLSLRAPRNAPQQWRIASDLVAGWWAQRRGGQGG